MFGKTYLTTVREEDEYLDHDRAIMTEGIPRAYRGHTEGIQRAYEAIRDGVGPA